MFFSVAGFSGGVFLLQLMPILISWWIWTIVLGCIVPVYFILRKRQSGQNSIIHPFRLIILNSIFMFFIFFIIACGWGSFRAQQILAWHLPEDLIRKNIMATGNIVDIPKYSPRGVQFLFKIIQFNNKSANALIRLNWYQSTPPLLHVGDFWQLILRLKPANGLHNPGGFDYQHWLFVHGIRASGYVVAQKSNKLLNSAKAWQYPVLLFRQKIDNLIQQSVPNPELAAIISALTVGSTAQLNNEQWSVFQRTGTSHLIAISGLHVGLVGIAIYFLINYLWRLFPRFLLYLPAPKVAAIGALLGTTAYGALAGFSLPTQRTVIMIAAIILGAFFYRLIPLWRRLLLAWLLILILQPFAIFSASLWLSFVAVACIAYVTCARLKIKDKSTQQASFFMRCKQRIQAWNNIQWAIFVGLAPLTLWYFGQLSLISFFINAIAIPWIGMMVVPICLIAVLFSLFSNFMAGKIFYLAAISLKPLWIILEKAALISFAAWHHAISNFWVFFAAIIAALLLLVPRGVGGRCFAVLWALPLFFFRMPSPSSGAVWFTLLDVGQGLAAVVRTAHHILVYDTGPLSYMGFDAGKTVLIPYLGHIGVHEINKLVISHGDNDHIGGAKSLLAAIPVQQIISSIPERFNGISVQSCVQGQQWNWDGVHFSMLYPPQGQSYQRNNSSCVLRIQDRQHVLLLTGDILGRAERWLLKHSPEDLAADILVAPHHGSKSSSTIGFIQAIKPKYVLFPVGQYNRFGFPAPVVMQRYQQQSAQLFSTAQQGAVNVRISASGQVRLSTSYQPKYFWQK